MQKAKDNSAVKEILKGGATGCIAFAIMCLGLCAVLLKAGISRDMYLPLLMITSAVSGLIGGFISVRKKRENGLINGLISSVIPSIMILVSMSVAYKSFSVFELIVLACCLFGGGLGGIAAVNIKKKRKPTKKR